MSAELATHIVNEDGSVTYVARISNTLGQRITQASLSSITAEIEPEGGSVSQASVSIASAVYDTLQTNSVIWPFSPGYNFVYVIPGSSLPDAGKRYKFQVWFTPASGEVFCTPPRWLETNDGTR